MLENNMAMYRGLGAVFKIPAREKMVEVQQHRNPNKIECKRLTSNGTVDRLGFCTFSPLSRMYIPFDRPKL